MIYRSFEVLFSASYTTYKSKAVGKSNSQSVSSKKVVIGQVRIGDGALQITHIFTSPESSNEKQN